MSCSSSGSSPRRVPGSLSRRTPSCRRSTANASSPMVLSASIAVGPRSGEPGISWPSASRPASNLDRCAGRRPHDVRSCSTSGSSASSHSGSTSTSTRRSCIGRWPLPTTMTVSSSATSAASTPPTRKAKGRRRVRTWSTSCTSPHTDDGAQASPHRSVGSEGGEARGRKDLGDLESLAQSVAPGRSRVLQRDFVVAAPASRPRRRSRRGRCASRRCRSRSRRGDAGCAPRP